MLRRMQRFFKDKGAIGRFLSRLATQVCPRCGRQGAFVRHGFIRGAVSPTEHGVRGWRIFCDPHSPHGQGCGWAPALWLSSTLLRRCFTAEQLLLFILALCAGLSVYAAWRRSHIPLSLRSGYRLHRRLVLCQSTLRSRLCSRAPPPEKESASSPLLQVFDHLQETLGSVTAYQEQLQRDFLALA
jgi:hypothetical protein